jgi:histidyl-tRNA synthetase
MRDFLPAEKARRERLLAVIRREFRAHGFDEIETPVVEDSARLHAGLGGDNEKLAYAVMKRGLKTEDLAAAAADGDYLKLADLGLRFDLTVPLARFYASHRGELPSVFRSIQIGAVWRAERPQKGRFRQFVQCDIDVIGEPGPLAETELLVATAATLDALGMAGCSIRINDRRILFGMLAAFGFDPADSERVLVTLDKLDKVGRRGVVDELNDSGFSAESVAKVDRYLASKLTGGDGIESVSLAVPITVAAVAAALPDGMDGGAIGDMVSLADAVAASGIDRDLLRFDPFLVRGMGYYTGTIFEIAHPELGYSLGGGGRYDGMIGRFLGAEVPATGFSLGFERLIDLVKIDDGENEDAVVLIYDAGVAPARLAALKSEVLAASPGRRVRLERRPKNPKQLLETAAASGFTSFAFVGDGTAGVADLDFRVIQAQ